MHKDVRQLIAWAEQFGWTVERQGVHPVLRHRSGARVTLPATPSDWRALKNARKVIMRLAGIENPSGPAGKYRKGVRRQPRFQMPSAFERDEREAERIHRFLLQLELNARERELTVQMLKYNPRRDSVILMKLAAELRDVRERLREYRRQAVKDQRVQGLPE